MFLTSGYVLIVRVLFKPGLLRTFRRDFFSKKLDVLKLRPAEILG